MVLDNADGWSMNERWMSYNLLKIDLKNKANRTTGQPYNKTHGRTYGCEFYKSDVPMSSKEKKLGIYIPVDTYMIFLERGRECGVPEKACFLGCF